jgi:hypothetical protein
LRLLLRLLSKVIRPLLLLLLLLMLYSSLTRGLRGRRLLHCVTASISHLFLLEHIRNLCRLPKEIKFPSYKQVSSYFLREKGTHVGPSTESLVVEFVECFIEAVTQSIVRLFVVVTAASDVCSAGNGTHASSSSSGRCVKWSCREKAIVDDDGESQRRGENSPVTIEIFKNW